MKRISFLMFMFAVCLLLAQCRKPVFPNMGEERTISFTTNSGDSKGDLEHNGSSFIYKWNTTDKVYVYASVSGSFGTSNSQFCGVLDFDTDKYSSSEPTKGYFKGNVKMPEGMTGASKLRFFHFGSGVNPTITGNDGNQTCTANVDFAAQNGLLTGDGSVSSKIIAMSRDVAYSEDGSYSGDDCKLVAQFAVGVFTLDKFAGNVTVKKETGVNYTGLIVDQYGVLTQTSGTSMVVDYRMGNSYIAFVPDPAASKTSATYTFETAAKISKVTMDVLAGKFLSLGGTGASVELNPLVKGLLHGKFSVSDTKQVQFSKGNLYWDGTKYKLEENQYDCATAWDANHVSHFFFVRDNQTPNPYDLNCVGDISGNLLDYLFTNSGEDTKNTNFVVDGYSDVAFRTLGTHFTGTSKATAGEWNYLISGRTNAANLWGRATITKPDGSTTVEGIVFLPDVWTLPTECTWSAGLGTGWNSNNYTAAQWKKMEDAGAVFLPAEGIRIRETASYTYNCNTISKDTYKFCYWSSTSFNYNESTDHRTEALCLGINETASTKEFRIQPGIRRDGRCIRLVCDVVSDGVGSADPFNTGNW